MNDSLESDPSIFNPIIENLKSKMGWAFHEEPGAGGS